MNICIMLSFPLACLATETEFKFIMGNGAFESKLNKIMNESSRNDASIINFDLVKTLTEAVKDVDKTETEETFKMYLEAANFEDLFDNFSENVHSVIEKRLNDALILK